MASFHWDTYFETNLAEVDQQHFRLVELINEFGDLVTNDRLKSEDVDRLYKELVDYTRYHFSEEENMMAEKGIDPRHFQAHITIHRKFLQNLTEMYLSDVDQVENQRIAKGILDFLVHWLAYHILGKDQNMARQLHAIEQGMSAAQAYDEQERKADSSTEPLLNALKGLFEQVTEQNQALIRLNVSLEKKVAERTQELRNANRHLSELSMTDSLTGLPNRRHAMRHLADTWEQSIRRDLDMVCMMIDADYFKQVNDQHGHDAGDDVLRRLSHTIKDAIRNDDLVCRLGGDEFLIICPDTDLEGGRHLANLIHHKVNGLVVPVGEGIWQGSISLGVAAKTEQMNHYEDLIKEADNNVYAAKRAGKNCVKDSAR